MLLCVARLNTLSPAGALQPDLPLHLFYVNFDQYKCHHQLFYNLVQSQQIGTFFIWN